MVNVRRVNQLKDIQDLILADGVGGDVSIAIAYLTRAGLSPIKEHLQQALANGRSIRLLIDLNSGITEPATLRELINWDHSEGGKFKLKAFFGNSGEGIFHGKVFISQVAEAITFISGSYNLTGAALFRNLEHGLRVECDPADVVGRQTLEEFNQRFWQHTNAVELDDEDIRLYEKFWAGTRKSAKRALETTDARDELWNRLRRKVIQEAHYWLIKCNTTKPYLEYPHESYFSFKDLLDAPGQTDFWGYNVKNPAARIYIDKDYIKCNDGVLFYHTGTSFRGIVGTALVVKEKYPLTATDGKTWQVIDIRADKEFSHPISLQEIRNVPELHGTDWASMNCILPVASKAHWEKIIQMGTTDK